MAMTQYLSSVCSAAYHGFRNVPIGTSIVQRYFHATNSLCRRSSGKYRPTRDRSRPLTYEQANPPQYIAHRKSWNSWNTTTLDGGLRQSETAVDDLFIRKFIMGTFPGMVHSEVIIKRQYNTIRIAFLLTPNLRNDRICFLKGYVEELLGYWFQCPVKMEIQIIGDKELVVYKRI